MKKILILLFSLALSVAYGQKTHSAFYTYKYTHTTDGTNDYYLGTDGVSGFSITDFQGLTNITIHILINFPTTVDNLTAQKVVMEIANTARTGIWNTGLGAFSGTLTLEYAGIASLLSGTSRATGIKDGGSISAGWHMITFSTSGTASATLIDGVAPTNTNGTNGGVSTVSTGFTANRFSLMATTNAAAPYGCEWRELTIYNNAWTATETLDLYHYYTKGGGVTLANSRRTAARYAPYKSNMVDLWKGDVSGTTLNATKSSAHNLVLTNF